MENYGFEYREWLVVGILNLVGVIYFKYKGIKFVLRCTKIYWADGIYFVDNPIIGLLYTIIVLCSKNYDEFDSS